MQTLFSTEGLHPRDRFRRWREFLSDNDVPIEQTRLDDQPFAGTLEVTRVDSLVIRRMSYGALKFETTPNLIRRHNKDGFVAIVLRCAGASTSSQDQRTALQRPGDFVVYDDRPFTQVASAGSRALSFMMPRERLESVLGPVRLYTSLTVGADLGTTVLATTFLHNLLRVASSLPPGVAARMSAIAVDLIAASIAERLAQEVPRPLHGTLTVQRAKAYVEENLGDPDLGPPQLAAAVGVSLRRLQELFHERGKHISDYIWERRLHAAAQRLGDIGHGHMPVGDLAYSCGFSSQAHFSRRFKAQHGMTPSEFRQAALTSAH